MPEYVVTDEWRDIDLDYIGECNFASFFSSEGNLHTYPAKVVPEMANSILTKLRDLYNVKNVLDPFVGSGTIALEAKYLGLDFCGSDLNPLAILLAQTKLMTINNTLYVKNRIMQFINELELTYSRNLPVLIENFENIDFWFKDENIHQLSFIKHQIDKFLKLSTRYKKEYALIMLTAFSSTIRSSSLSRNGEFKLYRMADSDIKKFKVDSIVEFKEKTIDLLDMLVSVNNSYKKETSSEIYLENAKKLAYMNNRKIDAIVTSPPYGDSRSTVAYGEFSKLSLQWMSNLLSKYLNIKTEYDNCDEYLLGGKYSIEKLDDLHQYDDICNSTTLTSLLTEIKLHIESEIKELQSINGELLRLQDCLLNNRAIESKIFVTNSTLAALIRNHIRLYFLKKIKEENIISEKDAKEKAKQKMEQLISDLQKIDIKYCEEERNLLLTFIAKTITSVNKKMKYLPKREKEIVKFFIDLYQVVKRTEAIINEHGIQVWIVGHRTVLGSIEIKLVDILNEWFEHLNYKKIAILKRNYHYKRLPHHINSTITRTEKVKTMNEEHVLIIQKI